MRAATSKPSAFRRMISACLLTVRSMQPGTPRPTAPTRLPEPAGIGTVLGGGAGLLTGLGIMAIPGVGPIVAAGWLAATLAGAAAGAVAGGATGGLIGAMTNSGVDEDSAHVYAEGVRRGGTLLTVQVEEDQAAQVEEIFLENGAVDAAARGEAYRTSGWTRYDPAAPAYTPEEIARERDLYGRGDTRV
jgi:hypothetical protein